MQVPSGTQIIPFFGWDFTGYSLDSQGGSTLKKKSYVLEVPRGLVHVFRHVSLRLQRRGVGVRAMSSIELSRCHMTVKVKEDKVLYKPKESGKENTVLGFNEVGCRMFMGIILKNLNFQRAIQKKFNFILGDVVS